MTPIVVRDLGTGELSSRPHDALTLDVPPDFPRTGVVFTVADGFRATYTAADGQHVLRNVTPGPLRWRVKGETCLIARTGGNLLRKCHYRRRGAIDEDAGGEKLSRIHREIFPWGHFYSHSRCWPLSFVKERAERGIILGA